MADTSSTSSTPANGQSGGAGDQRYWMAWFVIIFGIGGVTLMTIAGLVAINTSVQMKPDNATDAYQSIKDLFGIVLPLLGTWVGTILAFYFGQKNYEAATKSTIDLHQQFVTSEEKLKSIKITDKMIKMGDVSAKLTIESGKSEKDYLLTALIEKLEKADKVPRQRLPIFDDQEHIKYIIHRSLIDKFRGVKISDTTVKLAELTLKDVVDKADYLKVLTAFGILPPTTTLADAKHLIDSRPDCSDVFVTEDGQPLSKVLGWVTNVDIEKNAQL